MERKVYLIANDDEFCLGNVSDILSPDMSEWAGDLIQAVRQAVAEIEYEYDEGETPCAGMIIEVR